MQLQLCALPQITSNSCVRRYRHLTLVTHEITWKCVSFFSIFRSISLVKRPINLLSTRRVSVQWTVLTAIVAKCSGLRNIKTLCTHWSLCLSDQIVTHLTDTISVRTRTPAALGLVDRGEMQSIKDTEWITGHTTKRTSPLNHVLKHRCMTV